MPDYYYVILKIADFCKQIISNGPAGNATKSSNFDKVEISGERVFEYIIENGPPRDAEGVYDGRSFEGARSGKGTDVIIGTIEFAGKSAIGVFAILLNPVGEAAVD